MATTMRDTLNYVGELFLVGAYQTPFLNMAGGLGGSRAKRTKSAIFPVAQPWSLTGASQPAVTEAASIAAQTPTTYSRGQDTNTVQIFQVAVGVSHFKQAAYGELSGLAALGDQPVTDELAFQKAAALRQIAIDADYSFLNGAYQAASTTATAAKMRGIITAVSTSAVAAASAKLSKTLLQSLFKSMADAGAPFENVVVFVNSFQKQIITDIYGNLPMDRNVGGQNIESIFTDFGRVGVVYAPNVPAGSLLAADMNYVYPVFCEVPGKGLLFYEDLAQIAGASQGEYYGLIGVDYGPEEYHGKITGLATS